MFSSTLRQACPIDRRFVFRYHTIQRRNPLKWSHFTVTGEMGVLTALVVDLKLLGSKTPTPHHALSYNNGTKHAVAMGTDSDFTVGQCLASDENRARSIPIRHNALSESDVNSVCSTTVSESGSTPLRTVSCDCVSYNSETVKWLTQLHTHSGSHIAASTVRKQ